MRLVTFTAVGDERLGALVAGDRWIVDFAIALGDSEPGFASMQALIEAGPPALDRARATVADARRTGRGCGREGWSSCAARVRSGSAVPWWHAMAEPR